jgi:hypothetical protein
MAAIPKLGCVTAHDIENGNHFLRVEWDEPDGNRVVGEFKLVAWAQPPRAVVEETMRKLRKSAKRHPSQ